MLLIAVLVTLPAEAHSFGKNVGEFYAGMLHPLTAIEHVLAWLGFGLWAGQQGVPTAHRGLGAFALGVALGGVAGRIAPAWSSWVMPLDLLLILLLGLAVAAAWRPPARFFLAVAFLVGLPQGHGNTFELDVGASASAYVLGLVLAALVSIFLVIEGELALTRPWMHVGVRVLGSWIAAVGLLIGAFTLRGG